MYRIKLILKSYILFLLLINLENYSCLQRHARRLLDIESNSNILLENNNNYKSLHENLSQRYKRFVLPPSGSYQYKSNNTYQKCLTPDNRHGHCKHVTSCFLEEIEQDMSRLQDFRCDIEEDFVGVCCPDDSLLSSNSVSTQDTLAGILPAITRESKNGTANIDDTRSNLQPNTTRDSRGPRGCGINSKIRTRVIGGRPAEPKEWPWMVALLRDNREHYCGGVLITNRHILTAAHCVFKHRPRDVIARLGEYDFTRSDDTRHTDFAIQEIRIHEDFDLATYENDIAILKMSRATIFNSYIWPICLPPVDLTFEDEIAFVTGWGTQYYSGPASTILMEVSVPVWPQEKCVGSFTQRITNSVMCASGYQGGQDACQGDSGGPLVHQLPNGRWVNIGIVSWGIKCGEPGRPGIYTRVNAYLNWILSNTQF